MAAKARAPRADGGRGPGRVRHGRPAGGVTAAAVVVALVGTLGLSDPAHADSAIDQGREKIQTKGCVTCHDAKGQGTAPRFPHLAGQSEVYLEQQLKAFRSGKRQAPQMSIMAQDLSDDDISDLAAYYASLNPCACAE